MGQSLHSVLFESPREQRTLRTRKKNSRDVSIAVLNIFDDLDPRMNVHFGHNSIMQTFFMPSFLMPFLPIENSNFKDFFKLWIIP